MLFNSFPYLAVFLPISWLIYFGFCRWLPAYRLPTLLVISLVFYSYWDWRFAPLIALSVFINWLAARWFSQVGRNYIIYGAITLNLLNLAFFKYFNFFSGLLPAHWHAPKLALALPLGISFFTFHHVMYLTDLRRKQAPQYSLVQYGLYIAFFPQVLAGPLVRWREVMHQFGDNPIFGDVWRRYSFGVMLIIVGLCEKVFLGDNLAVATNWIFDAANSAKVTPSDAWVATLSFTFEIFFDFSGYTDIALGSALLFGIALPQNFNAPYRATSLQDFWRRWHMTLSRFLRDYLYIPLGGNRHGLPVQLCALLITMSLGGLWHGAGLTFVAWGVMHGLGLAIEVIWRRLKLPMSSILSRPLTFLFVVFCWVLFRAQHFEAAQRIFDALRFSQDAGSDRHIDGEHLQSFITLGIAAIAAFVLPNTSEWLQKLQPKPRQIYAVAFGIAAALVLLAMNTAESFEFIYFHF